MHIQPLVEELAGEVVELKPDQLEKYLKVGGHVRIIDGRWVGGWMAVIHRGVYWSRAAVADSAR